jgi:hypothetical protein
MFFSKTKILKRIDRKGEGKVEIKLNNSREKVKNWTLSIRIPWNGISSGLNLNLDFASP